MIIRNAEGRVATVCPECEGSGYGSSHVFCHLLYLCNRCGGEGLVPVYPLVHVPLLGSHLFTPEYVHRMSADARCFIEGWEACAYHATDMRQLTPHYGDVRDWLLDYCDDMVARQVALHVTRPNECFFLQLPVLF